VTELPVGTSGADALTVARACAKAAANVIRGTLRDVQATSKGQGTRNVVTAADLAAEAAVRSILAREFPDHGLLAEETASDAWVDGWMWVCDPIDGTKNYSRGIPHFAFSLALCRDGEPVLGLTTQPLLDWEIAAVAGRGCTLNGQAVRVSKVAELGRAIASIDLGVEEGRGELQLALATRLWPKVEAIRVGGSAALGFAYVATGAWDLYVHTTLSPWDVAAGMVLVREAGGIVSDASGGPISLRSTGAVAGTPGVHAAFREFAGAWPWRWPD
jgi:fructose-1,6-bisphosphatase/inositol monophosphatase family enzyme